MVYVNGVLSEMLRVPPVTPPRVPHGEGGMDCGGAGGCGVSGGSSSSCMAEGISDATPSPTLPRCGRWCVLRGRGLFSGVGERFGNGSAGFLERWGKPHPTQFVVAMLHRILF